jgi:hypothetical protein
MTSAVARTRWANIMKASFVIFVLSFFLQLSLMYYYVNRLYSVPPSRTNYPLNIHGWIVYLNPQQHVLLTILETVTAIAVGIAAVIRVSLLRNNSEASGEIPR